MTSVRPNFLPPGLVSNLQEVLSSRKGDEGDQSNDNNDKSTEPSTSTSVESTTETEDNSKPVVLVTNGDGIDSPGLVFLVEALVRQGLYNVNVLAPQSDKSVSGHSVTLRETIAVTSAEINGATAYEVSGTPVDCVSLALSGALFSWSKPLLVISGINRGSSCGHHMFYSGVVAGAREALICGVPSLSISLNWKKDESQESDFKDAAAVCLPLINAAIRDIEKGSFPKSCSLHIEIPTSPTKNKSLGIQLAQLGRDASAAGAARRLTTQKKSVVEIESVGAAGKSDAGRVKKYFRLEFQDKEQADTNEDLDFRALENGFVSVTPLSLLPHIEPETHVAAADWISSALKEDQ
ncbi:5'-nucleotidase SurE isoform X2 [Jatropha curcas]|uniref:5'-nucleotidase SurE isoform X2 n=1 Tax=Jatropha curcas TaxID=180498 RepID=UPI001895E1F2|nr:5'-nucleotidase SurE isoform X2 [Jatropha curcas]